MTISKEDGKNPSQFTLTSQKYDYVMLIVREKMKCRWIFQILPKTDLLLRKLLTRVAKKKRFYLLNFHLPPTLSQEHSPSKRTVSQPLCWMVKEMEKQIYIEWVNKVYKFTSEGDKTRKSENLGEPSVIPSLNLTLIS